MNTALELRPPGHAARMRTALDHMGKAVGAYVGGVIAQATLAAVLAYIVLMILGVPFAAALAIVIFFADLVPLVGATIGAVLVGVVTIFADFPTATIVWVIYTIIYQQIENTLIQPQIQKRAVNVHPFIVLVAVLFGSTLLGVLGALVAIPVAASVQIAIREWWDYRHDQTRQRASSRRPGRPRPTRRRRRRRALVRLEERRPVSRPVKAAIPPPRTKPATAAPMITSRLCVRSWARQSVALTTSPRSFSTAMPSSARLASIELPDLLRGARAAHRRLDLRGRRAARRRPTAWPGAAR